MVDLAVLVLVTLCLSMKTDAWQDSDQAELSITTTAMPITISSTTDENVMHSPTGNGTLTKTPTSSALETRGSVLLSVFNLTNMCALATGDSQFNLNCA